MGSPLVRDVEYPAFEVGAPLGGRDASAATQPHLIRMGAPFDSATAVSACEGRESRGETLRTKVRSHVSYNLCAGHLPRFVMISGRRPLTGSLTEQSKVVGLRASEFDLILLCSDPPTHD